MKNNKKLIFCLEAVDVDHLTFALIQAGREVKKQQIRFSHGKMQLLKRIVGFLKNNKVKIDDISGIIAVTGPGSFTSVRTNLSVINTWASLKSIPLVGFSKEEFADFEDLINKGIKSLNKIKSFKLLKPFYGLKPFITESKK